MNLKTAYLLINCLAPGFALHYKDQYFRACSMWLLWALALVLIVRQRWVFTLSGITLTIAITLFVILYSAHRVFTPSNQPRRISYALAHLFSALALYTAVWLNAKSWGGYEIYYIPSESMTPAISQHDVLLADTSKKAINSIELYDILVFDDPQNHDRQLVKRLIANSESGLYMLGDNSAKSHDSRYFGSINKSTVQAVPRWIIGQWRDSTFSFGLQTIPTLPWVNKGKP